MNQSMKQIKESIVAGQPLIQVISPEERRIETFLSNLSKQIAIDGSILCWDINQGFKQGGASIPDTVDPLLAINHVINRDGAGFFLFFDFNCLLKDSYELQRQIRQAYFALKNSKKTIFFISPNDFLPESLKKEVETIYFTYPSFEEMASLFDRFVASLTKAGRTVELSEEDRENFVRTIQGLTFDEAYRALLKVFHGQQQIDVQLIDKLHLEKRQLILKEGVLEYFSHQFSLGDLGGLDRLKDWLEKRERAFSKEARSFGLERPRGILTMGISGCGKSLSAKVVAALWKQPLYRLDMNLVYSGMAGSPELVFSRALKTMESIAPAVLWIDEIESGISDKQGDSASSRILGYFLTWMQEHTSELFIAATANRIDLLPAELLRRGRFDQIFFIDLPTLSERQEIFSIHLTKRENSLENFDLPQLAQITKGWSGSEIEQAIISAMYEAFNQERKLNLDDLFKIFGHSVPLSTTMMEQVKRIRSWAHSRAVSASSDKEY